MRKPNIRSFFENLIAGAPLASAHDGVGHPREFQGDALWAREPLTNEAPVEPIDETLPAEPQTSVEVVTLDSLGLHFGTDKASWLHDYLRFYEPHFAPLRDKTITVLEIGVAAGASLKVWESYFPHAMVVGADKDPEAGQFARGRVFIETVDQSNPQELVALGEKHGPFDIIVDDGSHMWGDQIGTLQTMFTYLTDTGIYVVEDLQTNFGVLAEVFRGQSPISCVEYLKKLTDIRLAGAAIDVSNDEDAFIRTYARRINTINFFRQCCLIQNGYKPLEDEPIVPLSADSLPNLFGFVAHIGMYGDRSTDSSVVLGRAEDQNVQGFAMRSAGIPVGDLTYRARLQSGEWTAWSSPETYVGTRYLSEDLSGFAVRLTGASAEAYHIEVIGRFRGVAEPVRVGNGEDCIPAALGHVLWGLQIAARRAVFG